jgi:hypothetical protein
MTKKEKPMWVWTKIMSKEEELMKGKCDKRQLQYDN